MIPLRTLQGKFTTLDFFGDSLTTMSTQRLSMMLLSAFALLALMLASVGIYGVISYSVTQRIKEIGVRRALGSSRRDVLHTILKRGLRLAAIGL